tara:strand:+ start:76 stop:495 length:420 start_codon:yes stop_codon:yes gene_type:complete
MKSKNNKNYKSLILKGDKLLDMGKIFDDRQKEIDPEKDYEIRIYKYTNHMSIMSVDDRELLLYENYIDNIKHQGGYIEFAIDYQTLGIIDSVSEFFPEAEVIISYFGEREDFKRAIYLRDELKKLKSYYENSELGDKKK